MIFRPAEIQDIAQMHAVRIAVKENILPNPQSISETDYEEYLRIRGRGWLCEADKMILGFGIIDCVDRNIWALFVLPGFEGKGIGSGLQRLMLDWYFDLYSGPLWLGTAPGTRAELFYRKSAWKELGIRPNGEIWFEMTQKNWHLNRH